MTSLVILVLLMVGTLLLGILLKGSKGSSPRYFRLTLLAAILWTASIFLTELDPNPERVLLWSRLSFVFPMLMVMALLPFAILFGREAKQRLIPGALWGIAWLVAAISLCFAIVSIGTPLVLRSVVDLKSTFGPLQPIYGIYTLGAFLVITALLWQNRRTAHGSTANQLNVMIFGILVSAVLAVLTNVVVPFLGLGEIRFLGPLGLLVFLGSTTYAIVAHHLFDVRLVIKRTVIFTTLVAGSFIIYAAIVVLFSRVFQQEGTSTLSYAINLVAALAIGFSFEPLRRWISERTDQWLFKKEYEQQSVIRDLSKRLNDVVALDEALEIVMQTIVKVLHLKHAVTYVFQRGEQDTFGIKRVKQVGYSTDARLILEDKDFTVSYFTEHSSINLVHDLAMELEREKELLKKNPDGELTRQHAIKQAVIQKLESLEAAVAVPLHLNGQPLGLILLSEKLNGEGYHNGDLSLLEVVGGQAISSIQKAKLYEGDQMKSEFVSIASHELLTPISAIEGYLSMILDEGIGQVDTQAREYLSKVFTSAKRLSLLIKDLLSVSRIESGKMKIDLQQLDMNKIVTDTIDQLRFMAADKGLQLNYTTSTDHPPVWADPDRTMQVMVNLVSNSIKYTKQGSVTISLEVDGKGGYLRTSVTDTGIGMTKEAMSHLFTQFYRVDTPETAGIGGTGLGLYITKSIIEKMGGAIECKSTPGKGTTFSFTLPLFKVETSTIG